MVARRKLLKLDTEYAAELMEKGETVKEVCERLKVSKSALYAAFERNLIERRKRRTPLSDSEAFYIKQDRESGMTIPQICAKWDVKKTAVYAALARKDNADDVHMEQRPTEST